MERFCCSLYNETLVEVGSNYGDEKGKEAGALGREDLKIKN